MQSVRVSRDATVQVAEIANREGPNYSRGYGTAHHHWIRTSRCVEKVAPQGEEGQRPPPRSCRSTPPRMMTPDTAKPRRSFLRGFSYS